MFPSKPIQRLCARCIRRAALPRAASLCAQPPAHRFLHTSQRQYDESDIDAEREAARQRAWYLSPDPSPPTHSPSSSTPSPPSPSAQTPSSTPHPRQPVFTSYDPTRTTPNPTPHLSSAPLPPNAPDYLKPLYEHLTTSELMQPGSVVFVHTPSSAYARTAEASCGAAPTAPGSPIGGSAGAGEGRGAGVVGAGQIVLEVKGEGDVDLKDNQEPRLRTNRPPRRMPRVEAEADWSVVPIGEGICVNLFTAGGRDKWRLDELWQGK